MPDYWPDLANILSVKPVWDELDEMMDPKLYIGRSAAIVEKFCGQGSIVEQRLLPYKSYISKAGTAELNV